MRRERVELGWDDFHGSVIAYGHYGRPVLVMAAEQGRAEDFENNGMVAAVAQLIDAGRVKLYCVDSADAASWSDRSLEIEERARRHGRFESWIVDHVVPWMSGHCGGLAEFAVAGCSMGAYHAANLTLKRADLFPLALCLSGNYDPASWDAWGEPGPQTYFNSPLSYLAHAHGDHLDWLRRRASLVLVVGRGAWEQNPTRALPSTLAFAECLAGKQLRYELDVWGEDSPHDWPSWRRQFAHHLARFC